MSNLTTQKTAWHISQLAMLSEPERTSWIQSLTPEQALTIRYDWGFWARDKQLLPALDGTWDTALILAGRGWGKTRTGAEWLRLLVTQYGYRRVSLVGRTAGDVRDVIIEGESGLLNVFPPWEKPEYEPSKRRVTFSNGAVATAFSADKPDQQRGPQSDLVLADELASYRFPEAWDQATFGNRLGDRPLKIAITTPRPTPLIRELIEDPRTLVIRGSTYENEANLATPALAHFRRKYEGTRLGRQELYAEILDDTPGALWTRELLERNRVTRVPELTRIVVAIDPAASSEENSSETGIVVAGLGADGQGYVLDDRTLQASPLGWAAEAVSAYGKFGADRIVAEVNNGGDMVETTVRTVDPDVAFKQVRASRGKATRAEPVSALYEQGRVHHVGMFGELEDQLCMWVPDSGMKSPDRLDALVWAITELMLGDAPEEVHIRKVRVKW